MARIRTIKPQFFRHEQLQDLERDHAGKYPMLVFAGLWTVCDRFGRFEWKPRQLKLDILPFLDFEMEQTLAVLIKAGLLQRYEIYGKNYGLVITFTDHQRISGKEAAQESKYPAPTENHGDSCRGSAREASVKHPEPTRVPLEKEKEKERSTGSRTRNGQNVAHLIAREHGITDDTTILAIADQITVEMQTTDRDEITVGDEVRQAIAAYKATDEFNGQYRKKWRTFFGDRDSWRRFVPSAQVSRKVITPSQAQEMALARSV